MFSKWDDEERAQSSGYSVTASVGEWNDCWCKAVAHITEGKLGDRQLLLVIMLSHKR